MTTIMVKCLLLLMHPFFISVVQIDHNARAKELEVSVRIFTDDLEATLQKNFPQQKVNLLNPNTSAQTDSLISRYISSRLRLTADGKPLQLHYIGRERVEESIWAYFEVSNIAAVKQIHVSNKLLFDHKKEQINMHHVTVGGNRQSRQLGNPESEVDFKF